MNKKLLKRIFQILVALILLYFLLFNEKGLIKYYKLNKEVNSIKEEIINNEEQIKQYQEEIDSLKKSKSKLEKLAREKYLMHKPNEKPLRIRVTD